MQIKCIEKLKFERSHSAGRDIGWNEAFQAWVDEGHSREFARVYHEGARIREIYSQIMHTDRKRNKKGN